MTFTSQDGLTVVTLPGNAYNVTLPEQEHWEQIKTAQDGSVKVYNEAVTEWWILIDMKLSSSQRSSLRSFFQTTIQFGANSFKVTPDANVDLGKGNGIQLTDVRLWNGRLPEIPLNPARTRVTLTLRAYSTGTSNPA